MCRRRFVHVEETLVKNVEITLTMHQCIFNQLSTLQFMPSISGDFLVLEQNTQSKGTIQRLQLFNKNGRYQKTLLQRGQHDVASMNYMALDNAENVVVTLKDNQDIGRVNTYNMQGEWVLDMKVPIPNPEFPPMFTRVAVDKVGRTIVVEFHEMAVHIYAKNGDFILKFGQGGRSAQKGIFENISCLSVSQVNEIYICDPLRSVQVCTCVEIG